MERDKRSTGLGESTITVKWWGVILVILLLFGFFFKNVLKTETRVTAIETKLVGMAEDTKEIKDLLKAYFRSRTDR